MHAWACVVHAWCMHVACIVHAWCMHGVTCMRPSVEFELCAPLWVRRHDFPSSHPLLPPRGDRHFHTYIPTLLVTFQTMTYYIRERLGNDMITLVIPLL